MNKKKNRAGMSGFQACKLWPGPGHLAAMIFDVKKELQSGGLENYTMAVTGQGMSSRMKQRFLRDQYLVLDTCISLSAPKAWDAVIVRRRAGQNEYGNFEGVRGVCLADDRGD